MAKSTYGVRAVANAVAELAYRYAKGQWTDMRTLDQPEKFNWDSMRDHQKLRMIKTAHKALEMMPPHKRFEEIDLLSDAWKVRNGTEAGNNPVADAGTEAG